MLSQIATIKFVTWGACTEMVASHDLALDFGMDCRVLAFSIGHALCPGALLPHIMHACMLAGMLQDVQQIVRALQSRSAASSLVAHQYCYGAV